LKDEISTLQLQLKTTTNDHSMVENSLQLKDVQIGKLKQEISELNKQLVYQKSIEGNSTILIFTHCY
jgi:septal ring factor EnvC (AmiA/AmiB activator)